MAIVDHGDGARVEYTIPQEIESRIPPFFYTALAGELVSVFGWKRAREMFEQAEERNYADLASSTAGWVAAFKATCQKLDMGWLADYYDSLPWYDSDVFDGIIEDRIGKHFVNTEATGPNDYYQHLLRVESEMGEGVAARKEGGSSDEI